MVQLLKKVLNSDPGDADHVGGDDWDTLSDYFNNIDTAAAITINTATAFASGKLSISGITGTGISIDRGNNVNTTSAGTPLYIHSTILTTPATNAPDIPAINVLTEYAPTQITNPYDLGYNGIQTKMVYGTGPAGINAMGTAHANTSVVQVAGSGDTRNEVAVEHAHFVHQNGASCSAWCFDYSLHGPVAVQPGALQGITMSVHNYYNGSPSRTGGTQSSKSYGMNICTRPTGGVATSFAELQTTSYPVDVGMMITGFSGSYNEVTKTNGFTTGIQIGGEGSTYMYSEVPDITRIGTGIEFDDIVTYGMNFIQPATSATTAVGISFNSPTRAWDTFIDLSAGVAPTTTAMKIGDRPISGTTEKIWNSGTNTVDITATTNTLSLLRIAPNISTVSSTVQRGILRVLNNTGANSEYLSLEGLGTTGFILDINKSGSGTQRSLFIRIGGTDVFTFDSGAALLTSNVAHKFETYIDQKVITKPANPATSYGRFYMKAVDANNDGLFCLLKIAGAITEVQIV